MGWFDEQIKQKMKNDNEGFTEALMDMSNVITGRRKTVFFEQDSRTAAIGAVHEILKFYHVKPQEIPDSVKEMKDILEYLLRPSGFMRRNIKLTGEWYKNAVGALLGTYRDSGKAVALIPTKRGYEALDEKSGETMRITAKNAGMISTDAYCFYRPLPLKEIGIKDLITYIVMNLSASDFWTVALSMLSVTCIGLFTPYANQLIFGSAVLTGSGNILLSCAILLIGMGAVSAMLSAIRQLTLAKIKTKMDTAVSASFMMRLMSLPAGFFKDYSAGELAGRMQDMNGLCSMIVEITLTVLLSAVFSMVYFVQIAAYTPSLLFPTVLVTAASLLYMAVYIAAGQKITAEKMELSAKESGLVFSIFSGVQKIKLAGAEKRAFARWAGQYKKTAELEYHPPYFIKIDGAIRQCISLVGMILIYLGAVRAGILAEDYMAFTVSYAMLMGGISMLTQSSGVFLAIRAVFSVIQPVLKEVPEVSEEKKVVTRLSGGIEMNNVSFRYKADMPLILDNLSLKIRPGQYVAIVGKTGCGKSTFMRLLLGFEKPQKGAVYYDGKDLNRLDLKSLRKFMGVVMQNGKVFQGDIFSNITISSPNPTMDQAWEAAEAAGIAEDIRQMPMGMNTIVSEGGGGFSGGQKQRLLIARAIASKPKVLLFDEATSALDNITQKQVSDALGKMKCTRIVIAHRLSTIMQCDRILVFDQGKIIEDGTYENLIQAGGFFADLVKRQRVDIP